MHEALRAALVELDRRTNDEWMRSLDERKRAELVFHDTTRGAGEPAPTATKPVEAVYANKKYYSTVSASKEFTRSWIAARARGKVFLDYACGNGDNAILAARSGAELAIGLDISRVSIENCRRRAADAGVAANAFFVQGDCERSVEDAQGTR